MSESGPGLCAPARRPQVQCAAQGEIIGSSPALLAVLRKVAIVAPTDVTVLICGETGKVSALTRARVRADRARIRSGHFRRKLSRDS